MKVEALFKMTYGMYIISTEYEGKKNGQVANVGGQITDKPARVSICLNKNNLTCELIQKRKAFTLAILNEDAPLKYIGNFGFKSGRDVEKFENSKYIESKNFKLPIPTEYTVSYLEAEVEEVQDMGNYCVFIGKVVDADIIGEGNPMTYAYYHKVKGGLTQKNAPTYVDPKTAKA